MDQIARIDRITAQRRFPAHAEDVSSGERFEFGKNWQGFLQAMNERRLQEAVRSLKDMLAVESLVGKTFLDVGSGSGLFSVAARTLGATVHSLDYDPASVWCTRELKRRYFPDDAAWTIAEASVLDDNYMRSLGQFDVVYSWGVLHHTGAMRKALGNTYQRVAPGGLLFLAIYNDQGGQSLRWRAIKRFYNRAPRFVRPAIVLAVAGYMEAKYALVRLVRLQNPLPFARWLENTNERGMTAWYDYVDWVGGYPFEVAKPEEIVVPLRRAGFIVEQMTTDGGHGCNQYVLSRSDL